MTVALEAWDLTKLCFAIEELKCCYCLKQVVFGTANGPPAAAITGCLVELKTLAWRDGRGWLVIEVFVAAVIGLWYCWYQRQVFGNDVISVPSADGRVCVHLMPGSGSTSSSARCLSPVPERAPPADYTTSSLFTGLRSLRRVGVSEKRRFIAVWLHISGSF